MKKKILITSIVLTTCLILFVNYTQCKKADAGTENESYEIWHTPEPTAEPTPIPEVTLAPMKPEELSVVKKDTFKGISKCPWSIEVQREINKWCEKYNVSFHLIMSMAYQESHFDEKAIGDNGKAYGAWQIHPDIWDGVIRKFDYSWNDMFDPVKAGRVCAYIMKAHFENYDDPEFATMAWNGGSTYAFRKIDAGEVSEYATEVLKRSEKWERMAE